MITREKQFTYWLKYEAKDCGLCDSPLEAQKALQFLADYLLGENWYVATSESIEQVNFAIVWEILDKYSKDFRKEKKKYI